MVKRLIAFFSFIISDLFVILLSFFLAYFIRSAIFPRLINSFRELPPLPVRYLLNYFYFSLLWIIIFSYERLYTRRFPLWSEIKNLIKGATVSSAIIMALIFITKTSSFFSRTILVLAWLISLFLLPLSRFLVKTLLIKANIWAKKLIIIGVNQMSLQVLRNVIKDKILGYEVEGFLDDNPENIGKTFHGVKVLGPVSELENISRTLNSKDIMIASYRMTKAEFNRLLSRCENICDSMWLIPQSGDIITEGVEIEALGNICTLHIKKNLAKPWNLFIKNIFDRAMALLVFIILLPLLVIIALAIKLDSKGPFVYVQKRLGQKNKMFGLLKFRSMYLNSEEILKSYLQEDASARNHWEKYRKLKGYDSRITRVGRFMRKHSLDELPQLLNVILGQMSLVGPRPYLLKELEANKEFLDRVSKVKPGITGLWQVSGRSELPFAERIALDEYYLHNWTLWFDIVILIKTFQAFFKGKGAY